MNNNNNNNDNNEEEEDDEIFTMDFIKKYIMYAKRLDAPVLTEGILLLLLLL